MICFRSGLPKKKNNKKNKKTKKKQKNIFFAKSLNYMELLHPLSSCMLWKNMLLIDLIFDQMLANTYKYMLQKLKKN